ncbi:hypothetical protein K503DRAFT_806031 [Rhizopogon vinicolor AM-OR11-026]|uniref:Uncharacterized protein n=1 Tax=Rhizopogon vinicolor AM-OR11-026 TaxID=1314800 RepID=A0A1B7MFV6_9AGAM|nr:hypothetical protein K503DRAFT_806031 [Rhizopogon vinicolor AM-OR11-026]
MPYRNISDDLKHAAIRLYDRQILLMPDILDAVGFSRPTFFRVLKQHCEIGHVSKPKSLRRGRPRALNYSDVHHLLKLVKQRPDCTLERAGISLKKLHRVTQERNEDLCIDYMREMAQYSPDFIVPLACISFKVPPSVSPPTLVLTVNALLIALSLPFELASPTDMTPSLLLAVLVSILQSRLPIPASIRAPRSSLAKVEAIKVFLGVLECDVLPQDEDIGLAGIDPCRLAEGSWKETVLVGELLCWLGEETRHHRYSEHSYVEPWHVTDVQRHPRVPSPSTGSTATTSAQTDLSMHDAPYIESDTSIAYSELSDGTETQPIRDNTPHHQPQCIHELEDPSHFIERDSWYTSSIDDSIEEFDPDLSTQSTSAEEPPTPTPQPLRFKGWIGAGHSELDLNTFAANKLDTSASINDRSREQSSTSASGLYPTTSRSSSPRMQTISMRTPTSAPSGRT